MALEKKDTRVAEALATLIAQFKGKQHVENLIASYAEQVQDLEDVYFEVLLETALDTAVGAQLDGIGSIVGEPRDGLDDDDYRVHIRGRIKINVSSGTFQDVVDAVRLMTDNDMEIIERFPAAFDLVLYDELDEPVGPVVQVIGETKPAGVGGIVEYRLSPEDELFSFASGDTAEASSTQGFSNDAGTSGGKFAGAIGVE
jgi:hypothetical protein